MADAEDLIMVVVDRDVARRVRDVEVYGPGVAPPDHIRDFLPQHLRRRQVQAEDPRGEVKDKGAGWYELPDGRSVRGKSAVLDAGYDESDIVTEDE